MVKQMLKYVTLCLFALFCTDIETVFAEPVTETVTLAGRKASNDEKSALACTVASTEGNVTAAITNLSGFDNSKGYNFKDGTSVVLTTPANSKITKVEFVLGNSSAAGGFYWNVDGTKWEQSGTKFKNETHTWTAGTTANTVTFAAVDGAEEPSTSAKFYVQTIAVTYESTSGSGGDEPVPVEKVFQDFSVIVNNQTGTLLTADEQEQGTEVTFGMAVGADGTVIRVAADNELSIATISGKYHSDHGMTGLKVVTDVPGPVKILIGKCTYSNSKITVTNSAGEAVIEYTPQGEQGSGDLVCWKNDRNNVIELIYNGDATTLTISGMGYCPYVAVQEYEAPVPVERTFKDIKLPLNKLLTSDETTEGVQVNFGVVINDDGSALRVEADDRAANAVVSGVFHDNQHGWTGSQMVVAVDGPVKIGIGNCTYGGHEASYTPEGGETVTFETKAECWESGDEKVTFAYYAGDATTLTIKGAGFTPYISVEAIDAADIPHTATLTFAAGSEAADGTYPEKQEVEIGTAVKIPANHSLYIEGKTLTAWTDGTNQYKAGDEVTVSEDITLTPIFTENTVTLADRTGAVDLVWQLGKKNNEGTVINIERKAGILVTQGYVKGQAIDVKADVDCTSAGKMNNASRNDEWAQVNEGTKVTIPSGKNAVIKMNAYNAITSTTINGQTGYTEDKTIEFTVTEEAETAEIVMGAEGQYYSYISTSIPASATSVIQEKSLYETDFHEWDLLSAAKSDNTFTKKTKYSDENIDFTLYNTAVMDCSDTKFQNYTDLPRRCLQAQKAADPYVITSKFADVTKVRFIHGATGSSRGWKLEAKGDGDENWVVISDAVANPAAWSEVIAQVNRQNVQLRWTNLNASQNAYMFELEIFGNVDMTNKPMLESFNANGTTVTAGDVFEMNSEGNYVATIEVSKNDQMISESNPITEVVAANGEVGTITYSTTGEGTAQTTVATIPVTVNDNSVNYLATFVFKPDFTLTYIGKDGSTVLGTQAVEKDAKIGAFEVEYNETIDETLKFRGWHIKQSGSANRKFTVDDVITADTKLYALVTEIETADPKARYDYLLNDKYFYVEDHEAFNPQGGSFHDATHGWVFGANDKVELTMSAKGFVKMVLCNYSGDNATITLTDPAGAEMGAIDAKVTPDGASSIINFEGEAGTYTLSFTGTTYIHTLSIVNMEETPFVQEGNWIEIENNDDAIVNGNNFLTALEVANAADGNDRVYIYLPNGDYNLGERTLTAVTRNNISIIGQSMRGVVIHNHPTAEGIGVTATILNQSTNLFMQDITLKNDLDYFNAGEAGRGVAFQDKGKKTICKHVRLLSYQDTYYSNSSDDFYWEKSEIHGVVDYMCGGGDVYYNECLLVNESRAKTPKNGDVTMTAPYPGSSEKFGYVFNNCTVENLAKSFNFGRSWGGESKLYYINTILNQPTEIASTRFTTGGMNTLAFDFHEYNTMDADGNVVSPASNILTFKKDTNSKTYETIMTADEAAAFSYENLFNEGWDPKALCADMPAITPTENNGVLTWDAVDGAVAYSVYNGEEFLGVTETTEYDLSSASNAKAKAKAAAVAGEYTVVAHNAIGAFGTETEKPTKINDTASVQGQKVLSTEYFTISGARVSTPQKGVNILVQKLENGHTVASKVIVK